LLCLPGTHTKWVSINDGVIGDFLTAPAGEIHALLALHSVLVSDASAGQGTGQLSTMKGNGHAAPQGESDAYARGLEQVHRFPQADLLQRIFQCRSRRLSHDLEPHDASAFMSGLVIGSDAHSALRLMAPRANAIVHVIGTPQLTRLYAQALAAFNATPREIDGDTAVLAGLMQVHRAGAAAGLAHEA
jgi:2-dehydro-3-deoxygalactonokinase